MIVIEAVVVKVDHVVVEVDHVVEAEVVMVGEEAVALLTMQELSQDFLFHITSLTQCKDTLHWVQIILILVAMFCQHI